MTCSPHADIQDAMIAALAQYEETIGEPFPTPPQLGVVEDADFWAAAELDDEGLIISVSTGVVGMLRKLWITAFSDGDFNNAVGKPVKGTIEDMVHLGLVWLMLHELHHYEMGHFEFTGRLRLTEANPPQHFGLVSRANTVPPSFAGLDKENLHMVEPCLEMQADHDASEMLLDAYSADTWDLIRMRTAAITAMMMLIEREDAKIAREHSSHPKAATRIFQLIGHVMEMPMTRAVQAKQHPELDIDPTIPSDEEQSAFNREVIIPVFFDAVNLSEISNASTIHNDLGEPQSFFHDIQIAKLMDIEELCGLVTTGAKQWAELVDLNAVLMPQMRPRP